MPSIRSGARSLLFFVAACSIGIRACGQSASPGNPAAKTHWAMPATASTSTTDALDFEFFETKVEPIFLKERAGHAPCYGCHVLVNRGFHLETLSPGSKAWTEEQSRLNFENILDQVTAGDPLSSRLLKHPLAPEAGGDPFHSGGRQFDSQNDSDWQVIAEWVRGSGWETASASSPGAIVFVYVTNSASDTIDVIDPRTNQVVQVIHGIALPHGIAIPCMTCTTWFVRGSMTSMVSLALFVTYTKTIAPGEDAEAVSQPEPRTHSAITCQSESF